MPAAFPADKESQPHHEHRLHRRVARSLPEGTAPGDGSTPPVRGKPGAWLPPITGHAAGGFRERSAPLPVGRVAGGAPPDADTPPANCTCCPRLGPDPAAP